MTTKPTAWTKVDGDVLPEPSPKAPPTSVLQDWVMALGLRLQGVLVSAIRGCDTAERHDNSKVLARVYRSEILRSHTGDPKKSKSYILHAEIPEAVEYMKKYLDDCDHFPAHYVMHFVHAAEILGYCHPDLMRRDMWHSFYLVAVKKYHVRPESYSELIERLEKDEDAFHKNQDTTVVARLYDESQAQAKAEAKRVVDAAKKKADEELAARRLDQRRHGQYGGT